MVHKIKLDLPGPALFVGSYFPPMPGGTPVIMKNLLEWLDQSEYLIATVSRPIKELNELKGFGDNHDIYHASYSLPSHYRGRIALDTAQIPLATGRIALLAKKRKCSLIIGVYPDVTYLCVAYLVHRLTKIPLAVYLHDTLAETHLPGYRARIANWLQPRLFKHARLIWVMSEGMSALLRNLHGVETRPLVHCYNEPIPSEPPPWRKTSGEPLQLFFSGGVYTINSDALARVARAVKELPGARLAIYGQNSPEALQNSGLAGSHITPGFLDKWRELLAFMATQDVFILALSWPHESLFGEHEMATIFPTKTPEYLAQGKPILVHCPADYFLARFFRERDCGWVVSEPSEQAVVKALQEIAASPEKCRRRCANALSAAQFFNGSRVARQFRDELQTFMRYLTSNNPKE